MNEKQTSKLRPTKKQFELLSFIEGFIAQHGYSPSYREIMNGLHYTSVATVSLHVSNLIKRGHLKKRDHSARSLEVLKGGTTMADIMPKQLKASEEKWLVKKVDVFFKDAEGLAKLEEKDLDKLYVLVGALKVLGLDGAASAYIARLTTLKERLSSHQYVA